MVAESDGSPARLVMRHGWYVLAFHEISWEESPYLSGIGGPYPPDAFAACVEKLAADTTFISVREGMKRWQAGTLDKPYVSFWFDDGFAGVRRYAMPILDRFGVSGAISVNSRFTSRTEMFWRAKLSYLSYRDGMRFVRSRLRARGYTPGQSVRKSAMDMFSLDLLADIDAVYQKFSREADRADAFRLFETWEGLRTLEANGWEICNHSSAHYPLLETTALPYMRAQFEECEAELEKQLGHGSQFWVAPFDRPEKRDPKFQETFDACTDKQTLVLVGHRVNQAWHPGKPLSRIGPPPDLSRLASVLEGAVMD